MGGGAVTAEGPFRLTSMTSGGDTLGTEAQGRIRRVAVLMEMEDGTMVTFYSETGGDVTLTSETETVHYPVRIVSTSHSVAVECLTGYAMSVRVPEWTRGVLDAAQTVVEP
jgi:hypothetical protein